MKMIYKTTLTLLLVSSLSLNYLIGQVVKSESASVNFLSKTPLEDIDATSKEVVSVINTEKNQIAFSIPNKSFKFDNSLMEEHFNEKYMESEKFPNSTFSGTINDEIDYKQDTDKKITVTGKLKIHGVEKVVTLPGFIRIANGKLNVQTQFMVKTADYKIDIPTLVFEKIAQEIKVTVSGIYPLK
jgi:polyisoprenoid-binding protein YceI